MKNISIACLVGLATLVILSQASMANPNVQWPSHNTDGADGLPNDDLNNSRNTSGCDAFTDLPLVAGTRNFDAGGGRLNTITHYLRDHFQVTNFVYDPFNRSEEENKKVLEQVEQGSFDTASSMSVLNVISTIEARREHLQLIYRALKPGGRAYFKIYKGDGSGIEFKGDGRYQVNQGAEFFLPEITAVFGRMNVTCEPEKNLLTAFKA